uniref:Ribosomal protein S14 n=1 Tax=Rhododendron simsii TaxID=118357 RepID=A0A7M4CJB4_RHOSS|nr:ribosomal protein S14 [Rhododendron simsii]YP_010536394.1 ribosomal protein S14 [Rhododendron x pulchrum]YP_010745438.1 ribosomal protein S14 [Rhododendron decorum]QOQ85974.1 ribosomal protein S14 [Rhododendron simsii]UYC28790.1 ribosomal protein S14 [Rhododendron x pulchrum]WEU53233.1 ribosomal protein S14 [Rhododendron decorum]
MSEKLNIRDHKHRLLAAKYELRGKLTTKPIEQGLALQLVYKQGK